MQHSWYIERFILRNSSCRVSKIRRVLAACTPCRTRWHKQRQNSSPYIHQARFDRSWTTRWHNQTLTRTPPGPIRSQFDDTITKDPLGSPIKHRVRSKLDDPETHSGPIRHRVRSQLDDPDTRSGRTVGDFFRSEFDDTITSLETHSGLTEFISIAKLTGP